MRPPSRQKNAFPTYLSELADTHSVRQDAFVIEARSPDVFTAKVQQERLKAARMTDESPRPPSRHKPPPQALFLDPHADKAAGAGVVRVPVGGSPKGLHSKYANRATRTGRAAAGGGGGGGGGDGSAGGGAGGSSYEADDLQLSSPRAFGALSPGFGGPRMRRSSLLGGTTGLIKAAKATDSASAAATAGVGGGASGTKGGDARGSSSSSSKGQGRSAAWASVAHVDDDGGGASDSGDSDGFGSMPVTYHIPIEVSGGDSSATGSGSAAAGATADSRSALDAPPRSGFGFQSPEQPWVRARLRRWAHQSRCWHIVHSWCEVGLVVFCLAHRFVTNLARRPPHHRDEQASHCWRNLLTAWTCAARPARAWCNSRGETAMQPASMRWRHRVAAGRMPHDSVQH